MRNILSLFDGISCGRLALDRAGIKYEKYYASEIDKYAIAVTRYNYPDTIFVGDIRNLKGEDFKDIDLIMGGSPCFAEGTKVLTKEGYKNIEDIKLNDYVLTHNKRFCRVLDIGYRYAETYIVKAQGILSIETTFNHPFLVREISWKWNSKKRTKERVWSEPKWKNAEKLTKNDFIGIPIIEIEENPYNLTKEDCWLIGRYIADGHIRKTKRKGRKNSYQYQVVYSIGEHKVEEFKQKVKHRYFSCYKHSKSTYKCVINSKEFLELLEKLDVGKGAKSKKISLPLLLLPRELLKEVIEGYLSGDGYYDSKQDMYKATTISEELALSLQLAVTKVYKVNSSIYFYKRPNKYIIEGRIVNQNDTYFVEFRTGNRKQRRAVVIDGIVWVPVKEVIKTGLFKKVYNLEVENDNTYTANNVIVHNCQNFSFSGKKQGMITKEKIEVTTLEQYLELKEQGFEFEGQSYLFWEFVRLLKEIKPKWFLLENVRMAKKWRDVITNALEVEPIEINSALVSAQNRRRLYWTNIPVKGLPKDKGILLKDILEDEVDEKYYLDKGIEILNKQKGGLCKEIGKLEIKGFDCIRRVYSPEGKSPTLIAMQGGYRQPKIIEEKYYLSEKHFKAFLKSYKNFSLDDRNSKSKPLLATYYKQPPHCPYILDKDKSLCMDACYYKGGNLKQYFEKHRRQLVFKVNEENKVRVRRLTPLECERLQTLPDNYTQYGLFDDGKIRKISDTQRYKMIGNGWTVDVIAWIFSFINDE